MDREGARHDGGRADPGDGEPDRRRPHRARLAGPSGGPRPSRALPRGPPSRCGWLRRPRVVRRDLPPLLHVRMGGPTRPLAQRLEAHRRPDRRAVRLEPRPARAVEPRRARARRRPGHAGRAGSAACADRLTRAGDEARDRSDDRRAPAEPRVRRRRHPGGARQSRDQARPQDDDRSPRRSRARARVHGRPCVRRGGEGARRGA